MLKEITYPAHRRFRSRTQWEPIGFFSDCLCNSYQFDLMLGFFSSSAISVLSCGFASFIYRGGRMRLIVNDILTEQDREAIALGQSEDAIPYFDITDIQKLKSTLSEQDGHFFDCLAWLIRHERLDIKIVSPKEGYGISHTKSGVFNDGVNQVGFDGSCNFSRTALIDNIESLTVSCDWDGKIEQAKILELQLDFDRVFSGNDPSLNYVSTDHIKSHITKSFPDKELTTLLENEKALIRKQRFLELPLHIDRVLKRAQEHIEQLEGGTTEEEESLEALSDTPAFPAGGKPREYQTLAFEKWKGNRQRGLFAMATGTGKTITALNCLLEIYKRNKYYKAIILAPTITLVDQWEKECRKFGFNNIVKVYSKAKKWDSAIDELKLLEMMNGTMDNTSYVIVSTYASFSKGKVFDRMTSLDRKKVLFVADECHNMGTGSIVKNLQNIPYLRRIGLSATPDRQFDEEGNWALKEFFGATDGNTFEFSMREAIDQGFLCRYYYYPHIIHLEAAEMAAYAELSAKICKLMQFGDEVDNEPLKMLLLKRKRIIHKATNKTAVFRQILQERIAHTGSLKYTLVYVPEGNKPDMEHVSLLDNYADYFDHQESIEEDGESIHLIDEYTKIVKEMGHQIAVRRFMSDSKERDKMLRDFANGSIDVLTSMKCLDEGVDVPRSELAIFCSSTGNPRQFIQRRGRVLRTHKDKRHAEIHDLVVVPDNIFDGENFELERRLVESELRRVHDFATLSENCNDTYNELHDVLANYDLSIFNTDAYGEKNVNQ